MRFGEGSDAAFNEARFIHFFEDGRKKLLTNEKSGSAASRF
jgi:hypothetical protein